MTYSSNVTSKGQVTIPKEFRDKLELDRIPRVVFSLNNNGDIIMRRAKTITEIRSILGTPSHREPLTEHEKRVIPQIHKLDQ
jgi:AbrB family looped-hinge helix DNA binding protein